MRVTVWLAVATAAAVACGSATKPNLRFAPQATGRDEWLPQDAGLVLEVIHEPPIPGYVPDETGYEHHRGMSTPRNEGVITLVLRATHAEIGRIEHADDSRSIYRVPDYRHAKRMDERSSNAATMLFVPTVGPRGERQITRYLYLPYRAGYLEPGETPNPESLTLFGSPLDRAAVTTAKLARGVALVVRLSPESCEAHPLEWEGDATWYHLGEVDASCDAAVARLDANVTAMVDGDRRSDAIAAAHQASTEQAEHVGYVQHEIGGAYADEAKLREQYLEAASQGKYETACAIGTQMKLGHHLALVLVRLGMDSWKNVDSEEASCVRKRGLAPPEGEQLSLAWLRRFDPDKYEAKMRELNAPKTQQPAPNSPAPPSGYIPSGASNHDAYMKSVNDYLYGSGSSSTCPFSDRSYC